MPLAFRTTKSICKLLEMIITGTYGNKTYVSELLVSRKGSSGLFPSCYTFNRSPFMHDFGNKSDLHNNLFH